ncbi:MAG: Autoinducer 2 import system permease protein LsrD [Firmicutes bacterium ADurb.Bin182]|nr:MAG: Autoinducer 2 import system permease protein LsrD [Firmicutes bacterium ADurb.Bin182]
MATKSGRTISATREKSLKSFFLRWEFLLILLFVAVNIINATISENYLNAANLFTAISTFLVKGFIALPMAYILMMGDIDLSVGSQVALAATLLGISYNFGLPMWAAVLIALACGILCGFLNGLILTRFIELAPMIVTLGTMTLYRGIAEMILESQSTGGFHNSRWFYNLYYGRIGAVPYIFLIFIVLAVIFGLVLHKTVFGRQLYAIGSNRLVAGYAGIPGSSKATLTRA